MNRILLATIALALCCVQAHAGRPLATEDAAVLERGDCELETYIARQTEHNLASARARSVQFGCGIDMDTQVALAVALAKAGGATDRSVSVVGKTALHQAKADQTAFTLAWGAAWVQPTGGSSRHEATFLNGVVTHPLADSLKLHANIGWSRSQSARSSTTGWAVALEKSYASGVDAMAEIFGNDRDNAAWLQIGARWAAIPDRLFLDASWGMQTSSARPKNTTVGLKVAF